MSLMEKLQILITADSGGAIREFKKVGTTADKELGKATGSVDRISSRMMSMGSAAVIGAAAVAVGLASLAKDASDAEQQQLKLTNSIRNSGEAFKGNGKALRDQASALMKVTAADDDAIVSAQALMVQFGKSEDEVLSLTPLVVDLSRKLGVDLDTASKAVSKSSEGSFGALKKMGVSVTDLGGGATATESTIAALSATVGGFAEAEGQTYAGQLEIMKNKFGELRESIGGGVLDIVNPIISFGAAVSDVNPKITETVGQVAALGTIGAGLVGSLSVGTGAVMKMRDNFTTLTGTGDSAVRSLNNVGKAAGGLAVATVVVGGLLILRNAIDKAAGGAQDLTAATEDLSAAQTDLASSKAVGAAIEATGRLDFVVKAISGTLGVGQDATAAFNESLAQSPALAQKFIDTIKNSPKDYKIFDEKEGVNLDELKGKIGITTQELKAWQDQVNNKKTVDIAAAQAQKTYSADVAEGAKQLEIATDAVAATEEGLKAYDEQLKLTTLTQGAAAESAKAFADALENTTVIDDAIAGASAMGSTFRTFGTDIAALPKDIDLTKLALGGYNEEQQKSIDALVSAGEANSTYLSGLIEQGASADEVRGKAAALREGYVAQARQLGLNDEQTQKYLQTLGLTPEQVETAMKLSGDADARFRIEALQGIIAQTPANKLTEYVARINRGDYQGAFKELTNLAKERDAPFRPRVVGTFSALFQTISVPGRAVGGPVSGQSTYSVNEKGPELFTPKSSGFIMNAGDTQQMLRGVSTLIAGGGRGGGASQVNVTVPVTFAGPVAQDSVRWITDTITKATRTGILNAGVLSGAGR